MFVYSGHDDTVAPLLAALNVYNDIRPPYASCVFVELWDGPQLKVSGGLQVQPQA
jgi:hypothetical protein